MVELKVVTYNLNNSVQEKRILRNIQNLSSQGVNLFCLQEVRPARKRKFIGDLMLEKLGRNWQGEFLLNLKQNYDYGLAILWKSSDISPLKFQSISLPRIDRLTPFEKTIGLIQKNGVDYFQRGSLMGIFKFRNELIRVTNVHFDWRGGFNHRARQLRHLVQHIESQPFAGSEIICGDFNSIGFFSNSKQMKQVYKILGDAFTNSIPMFRSTTTHYQQLDHIFVKNLKIAQTQIHRMPGSDHFPVSAKLRVK